MALFSSLENEDKVARAIKSIAVSFDRFMDLLERLEALAMKEIKRKEKHDG